MLSGLLSAGIGIASADTTAEIGFTNLGIHAGRGLNMSLPGGYFEGQDRFGSGYQASARFVAAGGKNDATFYSGDAGIGKAYALGGLGSLTPSLRFGYERLDVMGGSLSAAYGTLHVHYAYPITRDVSVYANGDIGRDFATRVTGLSTIGGLMYGAGVGAGFRVGPGTLDAGFSYQHLPLSNSHDLHLTTDQFTVGYNLYFYGARHG